MPMTADKLKVYLASRDLSADGGALPQRTAYSGSALDAIRDTDLTESDGYWNGALGWFDGSTATAALRGLFFHVRTWAVVGTPGHNKLLVLSKPLPAVPAAGDTFRLVLGGKWRSATEAFGMALDGDQPELKTVAGVNITGLTIKKAAGGLGGAQTLTLSFDKANMLLYAKVGAEEDGVGLDVSANVTGGHVYTSDGQAWVRVDVVTASLPGTNQEDDWALTYPERTLTPDFEGYETRDPKGGKTRYRLEVIKNADASDMENLVAMAARPAGVTTALAGAQSLGLGAGAFNIVSATDWPTRGFWIYNRTKADCRYVDFRSGNQINCFAVDWAKLFFDAGRNEIFVGDLVEGDASSAKGYVDQIVVTSGSWAGNAVGYLILKRIVGTFTDNETLQVDAIAMAVANGASVKGLRGFTAVSWAAADVVMPMPDVDLGLDAPSTLQFEGPDPETKAPDGVSFQAAFDTDTALAVGTLAAGAIMGIWRREWIEFNHQKRSGISCDTVYTWT